MRILVTPTQWESQAVLGSLCGALQVPDSPVPSWRAGGVLVIESGAGPELVSSVLPYCESLLPQEIWLFGWCGGLMPELKAGDLVLADATILFEGGLDAQERILHPPSQLLLSGVRRLAERLKLRLMVGPVLTSDQVFASVAQKQVGAATGALAVEMEAGPLARWSVQHSVSFVHLRVVLDPLLSPLPETPLPIDDHGRFSRTDFVLHAVSHPRDWGMLWSLIHQVRRTRKVMKDVIAELANTGILAVPLAYEHRSVS